MQNSAVTFAPDLPLPLAGFGNLFIVSMLHARVCSGRAHPTPPVNCKTCWFCNWLCRIIALPVGNGTECIGCADNGAEPRKAPMVRLPANMPSKANEGCLAYPSAAQDTERVKRAARWNAEATLEAQTRSPRWVNRTSTRRGAERSSRIYEHQSE